MRGVISLVLALGLALPVAAQDGVASSGRLSDDQFYRLITCGAAPGGKCDIPFVRWNKQRVSVALRPADKGYPPELARAVDRELDRAIAEINRAAGEALRLVRDDRRSGADILVTRSRLREGQPTRGIPRMPDGEPVGVGFMWLWWDDDANITEASILISSDITMDDLRSVVLEELFQCLGFLYDIENPFYEGRSIVSQDSNETIRIEGQDRMALRRHYPGG